ncbi:MAG: hypothetical protein ACT4PW_04915 [Acidimicrobiia bacterium]
MRRRLLAVVFGVAVVAGALAVRSGGGAGPGAPGAGPTVTTLAEGTNEYDVFERDEVSLLCAEDLVGLCESLDLLGFRSTVEPVWDTVGRLQAGQELGADAWLTFRPFDELVTQEHLSSGTLARSPVVLAGGGDEMARLATACPDDAFGIACLTGGTPKPLDPAVPAVGPAPGSGPDLPQPSLRDPASGLGSLTLAVAAIELGAAPSGEGPQPVVATRLRALVEGARVNQVPYEDVRRGGQGVALALEADILADAQGLGTEGLVAADVAIAYPRDVRSAEIVAVVDLDFDRPGPVIAVLRSSAASYDFASVGFQAVGRERSLRDGLPEAGERPAIRTDLAPPSLALLRAVRDAATP